MRLETITMKSENAEICIYDKLAQLSAADSVYFMTFHRWILNYERPEYLTRVEFRFRRPMLRRYGITTFDDLRKSQEALPQVFGRDWFRILERDKVRGSENVIEDAPIWKRTLKAFKFYFSREKTEHRPPEELKSYKPPKTTPHIERLVKQAVGCLASAVSLTKQKMNDASEVVQSCTETLKRYGETLYSKVTLRQIQNEVVRAFTPSGEKTFDCMDEIHIALVPCAVYEHFKLW